MSDTIREQIISAIQDKLSEIRIDKGYFTDCGKNVFRVRKSLDPEFLDAVVLWPRKEEATREYINDTVVMPVDVKALKLFEDVNASIISEKLLGDLIEALLGQKWVLSFTSGGTYQPRPGDVIEGAVSGATGYVESVSVDSGSWADGSLAGSITIRRKSGTFEAENLDIGSESNVATTDGSATHQSAVLTTTDNLAEDIVYISGGIDEYPDAKHEAVGAEITVNVKYAIIAGDPYSQP